MALLKVYDPVLLGWRILILTIELQVLCLFAVLELSLAQLYGGYGLGGLYGGYGLGGLYGGYGLGGLYGSYGLGGLYGGGLGYGYILMQITQFFSWLWLASLFLTKVVSAACMAVMAVMALVD